MEDQFVDVEFLNEWMSNPVGSSLSIWAKKAEQLEKDGVVKILNKKVSKSLDAPPLNKMVESPVVKKSGRPKKNIINS